MGTHHQTLSPAVPRCRNIWPSSTFNSPTNSKSCNSFSKTLTSLTASTSSCFGIRSQSMLFLRPHHLRYCRLKISRPSLWWHQGEQVIYILYWQRSPWFLNRSTLTVRCQRSPVRLNSIITPSSVLKILHNRSRRRQFPPPWQTPI